MNQVVVISERSTLCYNNRRGALYKSIPTVTKLYQFPDIKCRLWRVPARIKSEMKWAATRIRSASLQEHRGSCWTRSWKTKTFSDTTSEPSSMSPSAIENHIHFGRPLEALWAHVLDYCSNSTIHGMNYMGERKRPWAERLWWLIAFLVSVVVCSRLIHNLYTKWDQSPVIVSFAEKTTPVWQIPFPAVTVCAETKAQTELFNYTATFHLINEILYANSSYQLTEEE